ncbi:hypothetical protein EVAR_68218_1 [Eumeta japonica]|uniref:RNase H type-1 domain-containing protein n=1 Tax=Eumeta variegata TaxID=151549 RepID=A0A4C2A052_EUMVA|nr:hypothetical protein EVAR_68218_1 [Eumeta japonica]
MELVVLIGPKTYHPLVYEAKRDISEIVVEDRTVRLFWVRAHVGIAGKERADELVKRAASLERLQQTMIGFRCRVLKGHGGFAHYLYRFKLKDSPYCACDPAKEEDGLHTFEECHIFMRECEDLEIAIDRGGGTSPEILESSTKGRHSLYLCPPSPLRLS